MSSARKTTPRPGFTLLEAMVAVAILSGILLTALLAIHSGTDMTNIESARNNMERSNQEALDKLALELRDAAPRVVTVAGDGSAIQFQIPVDLNANGTVLDGNANIEFGFTDRNGAPQSGTITYRFVQNTVGGQPEILDEAALGMGLNRDGDSSDRFVRGRLVRVTRVTGWPEVQDPLPIGLWIVQPAGNLGGDVDGDGVADPIFQLDAAGGRVLVNLWSMHADGRKNRQMVLSGTSICLRNR